MTDQPDTGKKAKGPKAPRPDSLKAPEPIGQEAAKPKGLKANEPMAHIPQTEQAFLQDLDKKLWTAVERYVPFA